MPRTKLCNYLQLGAREELAPFYILYIYFAPMLYANTPSRVRLLYIAISPLSLLWGFSMYDCLALYCVKIQHKQKKKNASSSHLFFFFAGKRKSCTSILYQDEVYIETNGSTLKTH